jgi:hypothetical protein
MTRLLIIFLLSFGLACLLAPLSFAEEQAQQPLIEVYKAPG